MPGLTPAVNSLVPISTPDNLNPDRYNQSAVYYKLERLNQSKENLFSTGLCVSHLRGDIFKSNGIPNFFTKFAAKLFADTLSNRHGCHSTRLRAPNHAIVCVSIFVHILQEQRSSYQSNMQQLQRQQQQQRQQQLWTTTTNFTYTGQEKPIVTSRLSQEKFNTYRNRNLWHWCRLTSSIVYFVYRNIL